MKALLAGYGEIGKGIYEVFGKYHDITPYDTNGEFPQPEGEFEILLVCIPWQENFVDIVNGYINLHRIKATIIFSTVPIGTTRKVQNAVHCPIEGKHPKITESLMFWVFKMGGYNETAYNFFREAGRYSAVMEKPEHTEALKLLSTSYYGAVIEFTRYANEVCKGIGMSFNDFAHYNIDYNRLYKSLGMTQYSRYILNPPDGNIGGHCVVPNAKLLDKQYPSVFLKEIYRDKEGKE